MRKIFTKATVIIMVVMMLTIITSVSPLAASVPEFKTLLTFETASELVLEPAVVENGVKNNSVLPTNLNQGLQLTIEKPIESTANKTFCSASCTTAEGVNITFSDCGKENNCYQNFNKKFTFGQRIALSAPDSENYRFKYWESNGSFYSYSKTCYIKIQPNMSLSAVYEVR